MVGQALGEIERRGTADVVCPQVMHLGPEAVVGLGLFIFCLETQDQRHQRFGHEPAAEGAEAAVLVRAGLETVQAVVWHGMIFRGRGAAPV